VRARPKEGLFEAEQCKGFLGRLSGGKSLPLAAALGVPMCVNAETLFPIASALMDKGMGIGAVVALVVSVFVVTIAAAQ
jgi:uncharacterized membrane protein YraQ (UPF0718 family)